MTERWPNVTLKPGDAPLTRAQADMLLTQDDEPGGRPCEHWRWVVHSIDGSPHRAAISGCPIWCADAERHSIRKEVYIG